MRFRFFITLLVIGSLNLCAQINPSRVEIMRDQWGVPHVYAPTDPEVAYGLAWAHAEDDFETIQMTLLATKQMLGRKIGAKGAPIDYVAGLLNLDAVVDAHENEFSEDFRALVAGFAAGLNAYAETHPKEVLLKRAFPVTERDFFKAYVLQLAVMDGADKLIKDLFDDKVDKAALTGIGSNAMVVSRSRTTDGNTYLAINSHQPLEGPAAWYEAHLVSDEGWNIIGGLFPGSPVILHGVNEYLGWAHTVNKPDKLDVFELVLNPENGNQYRFDGEWLDLEVTKQKLKVRLLPGFRITVKKKSYQSIYGPVVKNESGAFAFKMAAFDDIRAIEQWYRMNKANDLKSFKNALEMTSIPSFNIIYGDRYDSLFYVSNGNIPFRNTSYIWRETLPGDTSATLDRTYHPFSDLPQLTNPKSGYLFNTNHTPFNATDVEDNLNPDAYDKTMGYRVWENNRSIRYREMMEGLDKISWDDFLRMKYDASLSDSLCYDINVNKVMDGSLELEGKAGDIAQILSRWDRQAELDRVGPAHFNEFYRYLMKVDGLDKVSPSEKHLQEALIYVHDHFMEHYGKIYVRLNEYQFLVRGEKVIPVRGLGDVLAAMYTGEYENGRVKTVAGESYIMMVRFPKEGLPIIETINVYGASSKPGSPHYDDQMEMFVSQERKTMTLDIEEVRRTAKRIYHPK